MRDLNMIAGKISDLWSGGKNRPAKNPPQTPTTDQKIDKKMAKFEKKPKK
jgi:hypothetical protein